MHIMTLRGASHILKELVPEVKGAVAVGTNFKEC